MKSIFILFFLFVCLFACNSSGRISDGQSDEIPSRVFLTSVDSMIFDSLMVIASRDELSQHGLSQVIIETANFFLDAPYVAHTLESDQEEQLVVNLREFDCTTFVESVLALSYVFKEHSAVLQDYMRYLQKLRYQDGNIDLYPSRLHYFSDWLYDNQHKGYIDIVSNDFGDQLFDSKVDFMSRNYNLYPKLSADSAFVDKVKNRENKISDYNLKYVSTSRIDSIADCIQDGDIIAFCSGVEGLDIAHVGFAYNINNQLHFIHASTNGNKVRVSELPLSSYVEKRKDVYGIIVARPVLPN